MTRRSRNWMIFVVAFVFLVGIRVASVHRIPGTAFFTGNQPEVIAKARNAVEREAFIKLGVDALWVDISYDGSVWRSEDGLEAVDVTALDTKLVLQATDSGDIEELCASILASGRSEEVLFAASTRAIALEFRALCPGLATMSHELELGWFVAYRALRLMWMYQAYAEVLLTSPTAFGMDMSSAALDADRAGMQVVFREVTDAPDVARLAAAGAAAFVTEQPQMVLGALGRNHQPIEDGGGVAIR